MCIADDFASGDCEDSEEANDRQFCGSGTSQPADIPQGSQRLLLRLLQRPHLLGSQLRLLGIYKTNTEN